MSRSERRSCAKSEGRRLPCGHLWAARLIPDRDRRGGRAPSRRGGVFLVNICGLRGTEKGLNEERDRGDLKPGWARAEWRDAAFMKFNSWPCL